MITLTDLTDRFGEAEIAQLTDRESYQEIDMDVVNRAIFDAESEIESYLNTAGLVSRNQQGDLVYTKSPIAPKSLIIKACDICRWYLHDEQITHTVQKRYDEAIAWLKLVMKNPSMLTGLSDGNGNTQGVNSGICVVPNPVPNMWKD